MRFIKISPRLIFFFIFNVCVAPLLDLNIKTLRQIYQFISDNRYDKQLK